MNTATLSPTAGAQVRDIELGLCTPNPWNKERALDEAYIESIREKGQQVIALVRPVDMVDADYQIVFGARRWAALKEIGAHSLRAEVREMSDQEAEELCAIENKHRTGLNWRQEIEVIEDYLLRYPEGYSAIAGALGISVNQVRRRATLLKKLSKSWLQAIKKNEFPSWTVDHFESLVPFSHEVQEAVHSDSYGLETDSVQDLRESLSRSTRLLKTAPWSLDDSTLCPEAGSCSDCPLRSGANTDLFAEVDPKVKGDDRCLDDDCFEKKQKAFAGLKVAELRKDNPDVLVISKQSYRSEGGVLGTNDYETVKKSTKGAVKAVQVDGNGAGQVVYVMPNTEAKAETARAMGKSAKKSLAEKQADKNKQRDALAIEKLIHFIENDAEKLEFDFGAEEVLTQYALARGVTVGEDLDDGEISARILAYAKKPWTAEELWGPCAIQMVIDLKGRQNSLRAGEAASEHHEVQLIAWIVNADFAELREAAAAELPDPKSWGTTDLATDGDASADLDD